MISALFVRKRSIYKKLKIDSWDLERDAMQFKGSHPVICHPPCRLWGRLRGLSKANPKELETAYFAVKTVQQNGGILEHPAGSTLWQAAGLPQPGYRDQHGGYTICIDQSWFGHRARKKTLLYIVGIHQNALPPIPIKFDTISHVIGASKRKKHPGQRLPEVNKTEKEATPEPLAKWLITAAQSIALTRRLKDQHADAYWFI